MKLYKLQLVDKSKEKVIHETIVNETLVKQVKSKLENVMEAINPNLQLEVDSDYTSTITSETIVKSMVKSAMDYMIPKSR